MKNSKIAIIHDWYQDKGGAENVISSLLNLYPDADFFALVDFFDDQQRKEVLNGKKVTYSFIQKLPFAKKIFRHYLFLFPLAIERLDLREYDLVISSSHAVAKGVMTGPEQLHICINYSPMRYAWDMYFTYREEHNLKGIKEKLLSYFLHKIRIWDVSTTNRVDHYIANSHYIARRIKKVYGKDSTVIYPPVDVEKFKLNENKEDFYLTASRMVPYKKIDLIVEAFSQTDKKLIVIGTGPDMEKIRSFAGKNVEFLGFAPDDVLLDHMQRAKGFVFAAEEDFGIVPVEAQACGTPVICLGKGGTKETVIDGVTGIHFQEQTVAELLKAIEKFEQTTFHPIQIREHALKFSKERFEKEIEAFVNEKYEIFKKERL